jgi:hypothetical protein
MTMPMPRRSPYRLLIIAGIGVVAASLASGLTAAADRELHALYARTLIGRSATQAVVLVGLDAEQAQALASGDPAEVAQMQALAAGIDSGEPRLVIWPERQLDEPVSTSSAGSQGLRGDPGYVLRDPQNLAQQLAEAARAPGLGVDPLRGPVLLRAQSPDFPAAALRSLGLPARLEPLPARYVTGLPSVPADRVAAGEIPAGTFRDRVVIIGRNDRMAATIETPLGLMSPVEVEAHALLGLIDGATWVPVPAWSRLVALALWALGLARAMRGRRPAEIVALTVLAVFVAFALDAALFEAGLLTLGAGAAVIVAGTVGAARLVGRLGRTLAPSGFLARTDDAFASTTSGMRRKVFDA